MSRRLLCAFAVVLSIGLVGAAASLALKAFAADDKGETERQVKESEVPAAALSALKKLAGGAALTGFSEEIEHGHKFYEGSWQGPDGNVDCLVTEAGDLVEIEEALPSAKVPETVRKAAQKEAGDSKLSFEKKTLILYEIKFRKADKGREQLLTPDGRLYQEESGKGEEEDEDEDK